MPEMVARIAWSLARMAVTVACATGACAASVTSPTMVPGSAARATGSMNKPVSTARDRARVVPDQHDPKRINSPPREPVSLELLMIGTG